MFGTVKITCHCGRSKDILRIFECECGCSITNKYVNVIVTQFCDEAYLKEIIFVQEPGK